MKKIILSLGLLFAAGAASAQSYTAQPDPTIVNVVYYQKPAEEAKEAAAETTQEPKQENEKEAAADKKQESYAATPKDAVNKKERLAVNANKPKAEED
jgi:hypothetical protein